VEAIIESVGIISVQRVLGRASKDVGVVIVYLVEETEKEKGIDSRRIGWFGWG
jgi:hypothetical protein